MKFQYMTALSTQLTLAILFMTLMPVKEGVRLFRPTITHYEKQLKQLM